MIVIRNLSKTYHSTKRSVAALKNVSLTIDKGEIFV
jgi:ABC-type methionine transport system ATPase subunit